MKNLNELKVVSIRLVEEPPLYSRKTIKNVSDVLDVVGKNCVNMTVSFFVS